VDAVDAHRVGGAQHGAEVVGLVHVLGQQGEVRLAVAEHLLDAVEATLGHGRHRIAGASLTLPAGVVDFRSLATPGGSNGRLVPRWRNR
jgi:hypothetical protein